MSPIKKSLFIFPFFIFLDSLSAQDTLIERKDFTLEISTVKAYPAKNYSYIKTNSNFQITDFYLKDYSITSIIEQWITFMELEEMNYRFDENINPLKKVMVDNITKRSQTYNIQLINKTEGKNDIKKMQQEAFFLFCKIIEFEVKTITEKQTFYTLNVVDTAYASISSDQKTFWKQTDLEDATYFERIDFRRIADLLKRKLGKPVPPIPFQYYKFDIEMPNSNFEEDLQSAMFEHGLELKLVTENIEVLILSEL